MGKYEEALERAKQGLPLDEVFPELKESEDERIRKAIGAAICGTTAEAVLEANGVKLVDALAYLKKQKEPHYTKRNALFDKCVENCDPEVMKRVSDEVNEMLQKEQKPNVELIQKSWYLEGYHDGKYNNEPKWLIQTGKGGPMYEENPKYGTQNPAEWSEDFENNIRNLLHDKLTGHSEDGSMSWAISIDDKTLKDIVNGIWFYVGKEALKYSNKELSQPEWSEEDERNLYNTIEAIKYTFDVSEGSSGSRLITWLKYRLRYQPHWKPSKEQIEILSRFNDPVLKSLHYDLLKLL